MRKMFVPATADARGQRSLLACTTPVGCPLKSWPRGTPLNRRNFEPPAPVTSSWESKNLISARAANLHIALFGAPPDFLRQLACMRARLDQSAIIDLNTKEKEQEQQQQQATRTLELPVGSSTQAVVLFLTGERATFLSMGLSCGCKLATWS